MLSHSVLNILFLNLYWKTPNSYHTHTMPPYLSDLLHPYQPSRTLCSLDTSLLSVPHFCLETFGIRFFCFWPHCLEFLTFISQKNSMFLNFQKEAKNSSVWKASPLMFASVFFCYVVQLVCVCVRVICYLWVWQPAWCIWCYELIFFPVMWMYMSCLDLCVHVFMNPMLGWLVCVFLRRFNVLCYASGFYMLLFLHQVFMLCVCVCVCECECVVHFRAIEHV